MPSTHARVCETASLVKRPVQVNGEADGRLIKRGSWYREWSFAQLRQMDFLIAALRREIDYSRSIVSRRIDKNRDIELPSPWEATRNQFA